MPSLSTSSAQKLQNSIRTLGWWRTLCTIAMRICREWFGLRIYRVLTSGVTSTPPMPMLAAGYETQVVTNIQDVEPWINSITGFTDRLVQEAFSNGDIAAINLFEGNLVGYGFTSTAQTRVTDQIVAVLPSRCRYGYAAYTAPQHRNLRLAQVRWLARIQATRPPADEKSVAYIAPDNYASLGMYYQNGNRPSFHGLVGYWCWRGIEHPFNSPRAKRFGFRFCRVGLL